MSRWDMILLWVITLLLFLSAGMKIQLAKKKNQPYTTGWKIQIFLFPVIMAVVLALLYLTQLDLVIPAIFFGIIQEIICWGIRKKHHQP